MYTLKKCFGSKVGHTEPEDGYFVKLVDDAPVEGEDGGQVVQFPVKPLPTARQKNAIKTNVFIFDPF